MDIAQLRLPSDSIKLFDGKELRRLLKELSLRIDCDGDVKIKYYPNKHGSTSERTIRIYADGGLRSIRCDGDNPNSRYLRFEWLAKNLRLHYKGYTIEVMSECASRH